MIYPTTKQQLIAWWFCKGWLFDDVARTWSKLTCSCLIMVWCSLHDGILPHHSLACCCKGCLMNLFEEHEANWLALPDHGWGSWDDGLLPHHSLACCFCCAHAVVTCTRRQKWRDDQICHFLIICSFNSYYARMDHKIAYQTKNPTVLTDTCDNCTNRVRREVCCWESSGSTRVDKILIPVAVGILIFQWDIALSFQA